MESRVAAQLEILISLNTPVQYIVKFTPTKAQLDDSEIRDSGPESGECRSPSSDPGGESQSGLFSREER